MSNVKRQQHSHAHLIAMSTAVEILSVAASLASAVGGAFAAWAAFKSAKSAQVAQESAARSERRADLRELTATANAVIIEALRVVDRANELKLAHRSLAIMSGMSVSSSLDLSLAAVDAKIAKVNEQVQHAELFANNPTNLEHASAEDIDRVHLRLSASLKAVQAMLEDLGREYAIVESQCAGRRESMDRAKYAR